MHHQVAKDLIAKHPLDRIRAKIEVFDWLKQHSEQRVLRNPAGYLVASIRDDYAPPEDFVPKLKRARRKKQAAPEDQPELELKTDEPATRNSKSRDESGANIDATDVDIVAIAGAGPKAGTGIPRATSAGRKSATEKHPKRDILADPEAEKRLASQWESLPDDLRASIVAEVNAEHGGLLRWPAMMQPLYWERMFERFGDTPPEAPRPSATDVTRRILNESEDN